LIFIPIHANAANTITFSPASPQTYDGVSDVELTYTSDANDGFIPFDVAGNSIDCWSGTGDGTNDYIDVFSTAGRGCTVEETLQAFAGSAGTIHFLFFNSDNGAWVTDCLTDTYASCLGSSAYTGPDISYTLTSGGGGGGSSATTTGPTLDDFLTEYKNLLYLLAACFLVLAFIKLTHDIATGGWGIIKPYE